MSTFLELCTQYRLEAGIDGTGPTTVVGNTNTEYARIVNWINKAYVDIQNKHDDWHFMWSDFSFNTVAAQGDYSYDEVTGSLTDRVARYDLCSLRYYLTSAGVAQEQHLVYNDWRVFMDTWRLGSTRTTQGAPLYFTVDRGKGLRLSLIPDDDYTITGEYYKAAAKMAADADEPILPEEFHELLIWWAMVNYAGFEETSFQYRHAQNMVALMMPKLERQERPGIVVGEALC